MSLHASSPSRRQEAQKRAKRCIFTNRPTLPSQPRNPSLLSALPSGFVFVGSHQIAGRGRGSNNWLSPPGCLQFSLVLRTPKHLGPKLVFAQYLFGLSVVEAVRSLPGYGDLGLRLKWPNDLYADMGQEQGLKKIGGILVNSFFAGGDFTVIIGECGCWDRHLHRLQSQC